MPISAIPVQVFETYVVEKLRKTNPFLAHAVNESSNVLGGAVVHIPQAGAAPAVVKNRTQFPATAVMRTDSFVTYPLNVFSTTPTHVTWHEENEISYDKTDSVLRDHVETLMETVGDEILYAWVTGTLANSNADAIPAGSIIRTSGDAIAATESGQTGYRKALTYADVQKAQALMNKQGVAKTGRYLLLETYMLQQLIDSLSANQMAAFQQSANLAEGIVGRICGFDVLERSTVLMFTAAGAPIAPGTSVTATDELASLAWQSDCVSLALGDIKPFQDIDNPEYYGDIFSALVKAGGRCRRGDWKGIVALVQATPVSPATPTISGDSTVELAATATAKNRTYATSNGADVTASTDAAWLTVSATGKKVTFTPQAYAHDAEGSDPRTATVVVGIKDTEISMNVTVTQPKAGS